MKPDQKIKTEYLIGYRDINLYFMRFYWLDEIKHI